MRQGPWSARGSGIADCFAILPVALLLVLTIVGIVLLPLYAMGLGLLIWLAYTVGAVLIGSLLVKAWSSWQPVLDGRAVLKRERDGRGCSAARLISNSRGANAMAKVLVVYFSRSGTTQQVAQQLANALGADSERIEETAERDGPLGYMVSALEAVTKGLPSVRTSKDPADYELVVLGTPVWVGCMSAPVRSWVFLNRARLPRMAFFATMGGRGGDEVLRDLRLLCKAADAPSCAFLEGEVKSGRHREPLDAFVAALDGLSESLGRSARAAAE